MSKQAKKGLVPKLRFPEFVNAGEWLALQLIDVTDKKVKWNFTGGPFGSNLLASDFVDAKQGVRVIQLQNIGDGAFLNDYKIFTSKDKADELISCNIFPGDIIISKMGDPVGRACLIPDIHPRYVMGSDGIRVVVNERSFDKYFVFSNINSVPFRSTVESKSTGSTRKRIGLDTLRELTFLAPKDLLEQQKVGACLSSLDTLLTAEREKLEALREHKKGLMQQLFPAEGAKVPQLRFQGFWGEWEHRPLGDIGDVLMCKRIFAEETNESEGVPFYKIGTLGGKPDAFISRELFEEYKSKYNYPRPGEVLITCSGTVGKCLVFDGEDAYYQDSNIVWIDNPKELIINRLLYYVLEHRDWKELSSTTITRIYGSDLRALMLWFPKSKKEQEQVAGCLAALDEIVAAQSERIGALEQHKKGLMQGLFPING